MDKNKIDIEIILTTTGEINDKGTAETTTHIKQHVHAPAPVFYEMLTASVLNICRRSEINPQLFALGLSAAAKKEGLKNGQNNPGR